MTKHLLSTTLASMGAIVCTALLVQASAGQHMMALAQAAALA